MPITVDDDVFSADADGDNARQRVRVSGIDDVEAARAALAAAGERFRHVDGLGVEHAEIDDSWQEARHSCKYVSDVEVERRSAAVSMWLDCQSVIPLAMGEAFIRILVQELERHGVHQAVVTSPVDDDDDDEWEVPRWLVRYEPDDRKLPVGFPTAVAFPEGAEIVKAEVRRFTGVTRFTPHRGSWAAGVLLAVDDHTVALDFFRQELPRRDFEVRAEMPYRNDKGQVMQMLYSIGPGVELEITAADQAVAAKLPGFRKRKGKAAIMLSSYQRDPNPDDW